MKVHKSIKQMPWPEPYHAGQQDFIVTFSWPVIDHERLMVATFVRNRDKKHFFGYGVGKDFRLICSKKQTAAVILYQEERSGKRHTLERALYGFGTNTTSCYPEISEQDEIALCKWLRRRGTNNHLMPELASWVSDAQEAETLRERDARGELRDEDVSLCPEELPEGLVEYIRREVLPTDHVLIYKKGNVRGTCYRCRDKVKARPPQRFKQHEATYCPNCGGKVYAYLETSDSFKVDYVEDIVTIQKGTDGKTLFMRQWHLCRDPSAAWEDIPAQLDEVARYAVRGNKAAKWQHEAKEAYCMNTYRYKLDRWTRAKDVTYIYDGQYFFYLPPDWKAQLEGTSLQYCDLDGYIRGAEKCRRDRNPVRFLVDWGRYPVIEKLWKAGYTTVVHERVRGVWKRHQHAVVWSRNSIREAVRFPARLLKVCPPEEWDMDRMQKTADAWKLHQDGSIRETEIAELVAAPYPMEYIQAALRHASVHRVTGYLEKLIAKERERRREEEEKAKRKGQGYWNDRPWSAPQTYRDYLRDCVTLGLDLAQRDVLFPPNLEQAHARTIAQIKHKANEEHKAAFQKQVDKMARMAWERDGLLIRSPVDADELTAEGAYLHHCVGGYVSSVSKGETCILFIRRKEDPGTPFYTLEWKNGQIIQCRTTHNKPHTQDEQVAAFVDAWVEHITSKGKKKRKADAAA